jgi:predicted transport protein
VNPQKYYISFRGEKNFAFIQFCKRKMHIILMIPYEQGRQIIIKHRLASLSESIKKFYGAGYFKSTLENEESLDEVIQAIIQSYNKQKQL